MKILPVIMAGGSGTRLWPLSRQQYPKQFLSVVPGAPTMLQETVLRVKGLDFLPPLIICNEEHRFLAAEQLRAIGHEESRILLEPVGRNTAPAIALAALNAARDDEDIILLVLAADHVIGDIESFQKSIYTALPLASEGRLVTYGIVPSKPEVGYGYIEKGTQLLDSDAFRVKRFVEKPDEDSAKKYIDSGDFLWNSGMFVFKANRYLDELEKFSPEILYACQNSMANAKKDMTFIRIRVEDFAESPANSIDYAVMEKTADAVVLPLNTAWSDVGSWSALWDICKKDDTQNVLHGDIIARDTSGSYVHATNRLVAIVGVRDLVVIETKDAVLVTHQKQSQNVKKIVDCINAEGRSESKNHREVYRPWGIYDRVDHGSRYQVKRITVKPGAKLSVQMHHHRAEHWIVVSGTAKIKNGEDTYLLTENQSTYIPVGQIHSLENPGKIPLELIEVQSGAYLAEDDIVRFEDNYGRI